MPTTRSGTKTFVRRTRSVDRERREPPIETDYSFGDTLCAMVQTALQLYTVRDLPGSFASVLERVAEAGFDGVEFAYRVTDEDPTAVVEALGDLSVAGAHVQYDALVDDYDETIDFYGTLGCDRLVVPAFDETRFASAAAVEDAAADLTQLSNRLADDGFDLLYHNHSHEFVRRGERTAYDELVEAVGPNVDFEFDVGLARHAGVDPVDFLELLDGRVPLVHLTDTVVGDDDRVHADFGTGDLDVEACATAARRAGAEWFVYENGVAADQAAQLEHAAETFVNRWT